MVKRLMYGAGLMLIVLSAFLPHDEAHFFWERVPLFDCFFGFLGSVILIFGAKLLSKYLTGRDESYYE